MIKLDFIKVPVDEIAENTEVSTIFNPWVEDVKCVQKKERFYLRYKLSGKGSGSFVDEKGSSAFLSPTANIRAIAIITLTQPKITTRAKIGRPGPLLKRHWLTKRPMVTFEQDGKRYRVAGKKLVLESLVVNSSDEFMLLDESFEIRYFPKLYAMFKKDPEWSSKQVLSIAEAWHEGSISSAAVALESDLTT